MDPIALLGLLIVAGWMLALGCGFFWSTGRRLFTSIYGPDKPQTQTVIHNHPPPGYYSTGTVEGFAILPKESEPEGGR